MSIEAYATSCGYSDPKTLLTRTAWMTGAFTVASLVGPAVFRNFKVSTHLFFGGVEAVSFNLLFYNNPIKSLRNKLVEFDPDRQETMEKIAHTLRFALICGVPLLLAKGLTSWCFEKITYSYMLKVGVVYNGLVGLGVAYGYDYVTRKTLPGP